MIGSFDVTGMNAGAAWGEASQMMLSRVGRGLGFPADKVSMVLENILDVAMDPPHDAADMSRLIYEMGTSLAVASTAWIPVIGGIVELGVTIADLFVNVSQLDQEAAREVFPPFQEYSEEIDSYVVNAQVLPAMQTADWTPLFAPRFNPRSPWRLIQREHEGPGPAYAFSPQGVGHGVGLMPGTMQITGLINVYVDRDDRLSHGWELGNSTDVGNFYPSSQEILWAAWGELQTPGPLLYTVDTGALLSQWEDYVTGAFDFGYWAWEQGKSLDVVRWALAPYIVMTVGGRKIRGWGFFNPDVVDPVARGRVNIFNQWIAPALRKLHSRQWFYLGRLGGAAYSDPNGGAFNDRRMRRRLQDMRRKLLVHPARFGVDLKNVVDPEFVQALIDSGVNPKVAPTNKLKTRPTAKVILLDPEAGNKGDPGKYPDGGSPFAAFLPKTRRGRIIAAAAFVAGVAGLGIAYTRGAFSGRAA